MTRIYLIRHAEAEGNLFRRAQGHWNGKVTSLGLRQIEALSNRFKDIHIDAVYCSDLDRTVATSEAVLRGRNLNLHKTERLREICMGVWEGESWGNLSCQYPEQMKYFNSDLSKWQVEGSERYEVIQARIMSAILEIAASHDGQTVAIVSHGMAIKIFLMGIMGIEPGDTASMMHGDNTSVSLVDIDGDQMTVEFYNDNSHLGEELSTLAKQKWWRNQLGEDEADMRYIQLDPRKDEDARFYLDCYRDSWHEAHGTDRGFVSSVYLSSARCHSAKDPSCLLRVMCGGNSAGVVELDARRGKDDSVGWISLFYLIPEYRGKGMGVQLIGCAGAYFSNLGRRKLRLHVAVTNHSAIRFYKRYGFTELRIDPGVSSDQILMEREI